MRQDEDILRKYVTSQLSYHMEEQAGDNTEMMKNLLLYFQPDAVQGITIMQSTIK